MTYTDEDVERVALKICEALGDWNPVPMNKMAYEDAARAALSAMPRHVPEPLWAGATTDWRPSRKSQCPINIPQSRKGTKMADPKTSVSDYQRGKADAYMDVIRQARAIFENEMNDISDRRAVKTFADRFTRLCGHAELYDTDQPSSLR